MNGSPPRPSFSAVEKKCTYVGYCVIVLTTECASRICVDNPARCAEIDVARPHGPPPPIRTSSIRAHRHPEAARSATEGPLCSAAEVVRVAQDDRSHNPMI